MNTDYDIINGKLVKYNGNEEKLYLESGITEIGEEAFKNNKTLKSIIIPFAKTIDDSAFKGCTALEEVVIMGNLTEIGKEAFSMCISLREIHIPESVEKIGSSAFFSCKNLQIINLPNELYEIKSGLFENCSSLKSITIPNCVNFISMSAFRNTGLDLLMIPNSVRKIYAYHGFNETAHNTMLIILNRDLYISSELDKPGNWEYICLPVDNVDDCLIENGCIYNGNKLLHYTGNDAEVVIKDGIKIIAEYCFYKNNKINTVILPQSIMTIEQYAFSYTSLENIIIPDKVQFISNNAFSFSKIKSIELPKSVINLGSGAFENCSDLKSVIINSSINSIERNLFYKCSSLTDVVINNISAITINEYSFVRSKLSKLVIKGDIESVSEYAFRSKPEAYSISETLQPMSKNTVDFYDEVPLSVLFIKESVFNKVRYSLPLNDKNVVVYDIDTNKELFYGTHFEKSKKAIIYNRTPIHKLEELPQSYDDLSMYLLPKIKHVCRIKPVDTDVVKELIESLKEELQTII